jgi:copper(I)-binding protein
LKLFCLIVFTIVMLAACAANPMPTSTPPVSPTKATTAPSAAGTRAPKFEVSNAWVRLAPSSGGALSASGYMTITNYGSVADVLTGVRSEAFGTAMLHKTTIANDIAAMDMVNEIDIPAGASVELAPGSYHIMLSGLGTSNAAPLPGSLVTLILVFKSGTTASIEAPVVSP